jgi:hypothetical protein
MNRTADAITEKIGLYTRDLQGLSLRRMHSCSHRKQHPWPHHEGTPTTSVPPCAEAGFEPKIARLPARIAPIFWLSVFGRSGQGPSEWSLRSDSPYLSESPFRVAFPGPSQPRFQRYPHLALLQGGPQGPQQGRSIPILRAQGACCTAQDENLIVFVSIRIWARQDRPRP